MSIARLRARCLALGCELYDGAPEGDPVVFVYAPAGFRFAETECHTAGGGYTGQEGDRRADAIRLALADLRTMEPCDCGCGGAQ